MVSSGMVSSGMAARARRRPTTIGKDGACLCVAPTTSPDISRAQGRRKAACD
jgi:hypothetical protein